MNYFPPRLMLENSDALVTPLPGNCYLPMLRKMIGSAQHSVDVIQYQWNFLPHEPGDPLQQFNQSVITQIRSGVKYRVLLNIENVAHKITRINQGAERYLTAVGAKVKFGPARIITHSKLFIIDDQFIILGSHNLSKSSVSQNDETSVLINSRPVVSEYRRYFDLLWARN